MRGTRFFEYVVLRKPGKNFVHALSQDPLREKPSYEKTMQEYKQYVDTLKNLGVDTYLCEPDENFPDGNFVEDTYLVLDKKCIIELNPGAPSRREEYASLAPFLPKDLPIKKLSKQFTIDGGDILQDGMRIYVGLSSRTQQGAIDELRALVSPWGYEVHAIFVPEGLHLKSGMTCVLSNNFVILAAFEDKLKEMQKDNPDITYFVVPEEEYFAANVLPLNNKIMIPRGCPTTKAYIEQFYSKDTIYEVDTNQARLVDGALTCSSLLFQ